MEEDVREAVSGALWVFLGSLSISIVGLIFWFTIAAFADVESVGLASAIVSAAGIAATLVSAGLNIAVMRETAAYGSSAIVAALVLSFISGFASGLILYPLLRGLGLEDYWVYAWLIAASSIVSLTLMSSLIGLEKFRDHFNAVAVGSAARLAVGVMLSIAGFGALAALLGYMMHPIVSSIAAFVFITKSTRLRFTMLVQRLRDVASLAFSNYPQVFSIQLLMLLGVYIFAALTREHVETGILYISLMMMLSIAAIPASILNVALPIGTRRASDPFAEALRVGLGIATPIVAAIMVMPELVLSLVNPGLAKGARLLQVLLLSIPALTASIAVINKLNREKRTRKIFLLGVLRLVVLVVLLIQLITIYGVEGAGLAFLLANIVTAVVAAVMEPAVTMPMLVSFTILAPLLFVPQELWMVLAAPLLAMMVLHLTGVFRFEEYRVVAASIRTALHTSPSG